MSKLSKIARAKFDRLASINKMIDAGDVGAAKAKREVIAKQTDGRTKRQREPVSVDRQYYCPNGHNLVRK